MNEKKVGHKRRGGQSWTYGEEGVVKKKKRTGRKWRKKRGRKMRRRRERATEEE